jgi:hypothetical protein
MSKMIDKVAIMSSQKKNDHLNSSTTHELTKISIANANKEKISPPKKIGSTFLLKNHYLKSSPTRAKMVTDIITIVTNEPSAISLTFALTGCSSS